MALHRKYPALMSLAPDLAIIAECANPDILKGRSENSWIKSNAFWIGHNPNKGLAVFAFNGFQCDLAAEPDVNLRYVLPLRVRSPVSFNLLAVWAMHAASGDLPAQPAGPLPEAVIRYRDYLESSPTVIGGDLNNNVIWDKPRLPERSFKNITDLLGKMGVRSCYHAVRPEIFGSETEPTLYWRDRKAEGPRYHIDYAFLPEEWLRYQPQITIGKYDDWVGNGLSDHVPIIVDIHFGR
ncbi:MAG: hypothetical protein AB7L41_12040 [Flavobacteriaceae bacterium]